MKGKQIKVGDFITINKWVSHRDFSYCGDVLEVGNIAGDFVVCRNHSESDGIPVKLTIDLRRVEFLALPDHFVNLARTTKRAK